MGDCPTDPASLQRIPSSPTGIALSRAPPARIAGLDCRRVEALGKRTAREVFPPPGTRPAETGGRARVLGAAVGGDPPGPPGGLTRRPRLQLPARLGILFRREQADRELDEEFRYHLD